MYTHIIRLAGAVVLLAALLLSAGCGKKGKGYYAPVMTHVAAPASVIPQR